MTADAQPYEALGLRLEEYERVIEILGRQPSSAELAMYSVMWSEHCSYKSSKVHLRVFGERVPDNDVLLVGIGENAGVVDIGDGWAVTFKIESHNHPSYVEPYQGAATGIGGIVRDIISMGARPVAVMDSLRFGASDHPDTRRVLTGVVAGIAGYGNCLGLPNIGGETVFDACYQGNPLVNALALGVLRHDDIHLAKASGVGNLVVLYGALTGGDGIGGASILASDTFTDEGPTKRPSVQVGDPFMERLLIECTLEAFAGGLVEGIQDLGAAGLSCATSELASNGDGGMRIWLDRVPLRDSTLTPAEILMSESQERMCAVVSPEHIDAFLAICEKWDVSSTVIGEVAAGDRLIITWHGTTIVDVPPRSVAHDGPAYNRPIERPDSLDVLRADDPKSLVRPTTPAELESTIRQLVSSPNLADPSWVTNQYDRYVLGNTALAQPDDAGVIRVDEESGRGVALAVDCNARYAALDPYAGVQLAYSEAYRNVSVTGATPIAVTNCLNFGSPENPHVMWQFQQAVEGLADACLQLGTPVTGGNVSFYNQTGDTAIHPTPTIGVLGVLDDVAQRVPMGLGAVGEAVILLGETHDEFGGSEWAHVAHCHLGGTPPEVDLEAERRLGQFVDAANRAGLLTAAHDVSVGGLVITLAEMALRTNRGADIDLAAADPFVMLFSESVARAVVTTGDPSRVEAFAAEFGVPITLLGTVTEGTDITIAGLAPIPLEDIRTARTTTLPSLFG